MMDAPLVAKYQGRTIPDTDWEALDAQSRYVAVEPWLITPWRCWNELAGERLHTQDVFGGGMGAVRGIPRPQELPYRAVQEWCDRNRLYGENREFVLACVRILDATFIRLSTIQIRQELKTIFGK